MPVKRLKSGLVFGFLFLQLYFISGSQGISCYQCNSAIDQQCDTLQSNETFRKYYKRCEEHVDTVSEQDYEPKEYFCRKIVQHIKDMKDTVRVIRKCGWEKSPNKDCYKFEDDDHKELVCQCFTDGCNHANSIVISRHSTYFVISCVLVYTIQRLF